MRRAVARRSLLRHVHIVVVRPPGLDERLGLELVIRDHRHQLLLIVLQPRAFQQEVSIEIVAQLRVLV